METRNKHKGFDHAGLVNILKERDNWILSYNNCPEILKLYETDIIYQIGSMACLQQDSKEVLIINKEKNEQKILFQ